MSVAAPAARARPGLQRGQTARRGVSGIPARRYHSDAPEPRSVALKDQMDALAGQALEVMQWEPQTLSSSLNRLLGFPGAEAPEIADFNELRAESLAIDSARAQKGCVPAKRSQNL
jgi:hypothetical protein